MPAKFEITSFIEEINKLTKENLSYIDALVHYAETNNIEIETVAELVKKAPIIKSSLASEAEELNLMEKTAKLPT